MKARFRKSRTSITPFKSGPARRAHSRLRRHVRDDRAMSNDFDLVIRGGVIVDGTGRAPFEGDVAVRQDRIVAIGNVSNGRVRAEIDAKGCIVTPGFVDIHTHYDGQVTWENRLVPSSSQ